MFFTRLKFFLLTLNMKLASILVWFNKSRSVYSRLKDTPWSIQKVVDSTFNEWNADNKYRNNYSISKLYKLVLYSGKHPIKFSFLTALALLLFFSVPKIYSSISEILPNTELFFLHEVSFFPKFPSNWYASLVPNLGLCEILTSILIRLEGAVTTTDLGPSEKLAQFTTLWSIQTTLVAMVYPIVIAFVTVFLQKRPASGMFLHLYLFDSGAVIAGFSSVSLVLIMGIQYAILIPMFGLDYLPWWVNLDVSWFILNACLTAYFLFRTIEFLRPEVQLEIVRRYAINVALPNEVEPLYKNIVFRESVNNNWSNAASYFEDGNELTPKINVSGFLFGTQCDSLKKRITLKSRLQNVRLWFLQIALLLWVRRANKFIKLNATLGSPVKESPVLSIPLNFKYSYEGEVDLVVVENGPTLNRLEKIFFRLAFSFKHVSAERGYVQLSSIISELANDVRDASSKVSLVEFENAYSSLIEIHRLLLGASLTKTFDGTLTSFALLSNDVSLFDVQLHIGWTKQYQLIIESAVDVLLRDTKPMRRICYIATQLDGQHLQESPVEIREQILKLYPLIMFKLSTWWTFRLEEQGVMEHSHKKMAVLRPPIHRVYEEILVCFVSGWETARRDIAYLPKSQPSFDWIEAPILARLHVIHITETAYMLLDAVERGDKAAAEWFADVLLKWKSKIEDEETTYKIDRFSDFVTTEHLKADWADVCDMFGISEFISKDGESVSQIQRGLLIVSIRNFSSDMALLIQEILLSWISSNPPDALDDSLSNEILVGLLVGKNWKGEGHQRQYSHELSVIQYLTAQLRQNVSDSAISESYLSNFDRFVERVNEMQRPKMVSSRIYSYTGVVDIASIREFQVMFLAYFSTNQWKINEAQKRKIEIWISKHDTGLRLLNRFIEEWMELCENSSSANLALLSEILTSTKKSQTAESAYINALEGLRSLKSYVQDFSTHALDIAPIDTGRIIELSQFASSRGFKPNTGDFPLGLFMNVTSGVETLNPYTVRIENVSKGELIELEIEQRAINEEESYANVISRTVGGVVLNDILQQTKFDEFFVTNAAEYWFVLKRHAAILEASGVKPILILENPTLPDWVYDWQWQTTNSNLNERYPRPDDLQVKHLRDKGVNYICNFNSIEVYAANIPPNQSLLMAYECFRKVTFQEFEPGLFIKISTDERDNEPRRFDLKLLFSRLAESSDIQCLRIKYRNE